MNSNGIAHLKAAVRETVNDFLRAGGGTAIECAEIVRDRNPELVEQFRDMLVVEGLARMTARELRRNTPKRPR